MTDEEITLPPLPDTSAYLLLDLDQAEEYARAAVLLDRQQRTAPRATTFPVDTGPLSSIKVYNEIEPSPRPNAEPFSPKEIALMNEKWLHRKALGLAEAAPNTEPVAWIESPHGAIRANPLYRLAPPPQSLAWHIPLYTAPPAPSAERDTRPCGGVPHAGMIRCLDAAIDRLHAGDTPEEVFADFGWSLTVPPDHFAVMRQALEALEERYVGALRDGALDALRAALEGK